MAEGDPPNVDRARFIEWFNGDPLDSATLNGLRAATWSTKREHAILEIEDGRLAVVNGGQFGMELVSALPDDPFGRPYPSLWLDVAGRWHRINRLVVHTHPKPTGPSDADLLVLRILGQQRSHLSELYAMNPLQEFGPAPDEPRDGK